MREKKKKRKRKEENDDDDDPDDDPDDDSDDDDSSVVPVPLSGFITNVVFMGQGEPLDNLDSVVDAVKVMTDPRAGSSSSSGESTRFSPPTLSSSSPSSSSSSATTKQQREKQHKQKQKQKEQGHPRQEQWALSPNRVTVSTVGLVPRLRSLVERCDAQVALSLHSALEATRASIVPATARHGTAELKEALEELFPRRRERGGGGGGRRKRRHCLIEVTLLSGVNDGEEDARALVSYLENVEAKINLIPFNAHENAAFSAPPPERVERFRRAVVDEGGRVCTVRVARGADEAMAACGQLGEKVGIIPRAAERLLAEARLAEAAAAAGAAARG